MTVSFRSNGPQIIFEDESVFVVSKPSGYITNDADTTTTQPVLQSWIRENFDYPLKGSREFRDGIVHRLDKETSGILLIAKTREAFEELQRQFRQRIVEKSYVALVHGKVEPSEGIIDAPVGRLPWRRDRFGVLPSGRSAITYYNCYKFYKHYTLVEFRPKTGRTHQIRIHAKHIGHPLVGDEFYAGRKTARNDRKWCPRLFLHASTIKFIHPDSIKRSLPAGRQVEFKADLPQDLQNVLSASEILAD